jgi:hypothetical protein
MKQVLHATMDDLRDECVLVQAWKKTSAYLRGVSWYSDTLELDYTSLGLPSFIKELQECMSHPEKWNPSPLGLVPAPKGQKWKRDGNKWEVDKDERISTKMRPLAHVALRDQVVATAIMLCLADQVENRLGSPLEPIDKREGRRRVLAYGNRLYCDENRKDGVVLLTNRWGSGKLYRGYSKDYQNFIKRPAVAADQVEKSPSHEIAIVQSDLSQFYDRVRPKILHEKVRSLFGKTSDPEFIGFIENVFDWRWGEDEPRAQIYAKSNSITGFDTIALPQGLVASGFFSNIALIDFHEAIRSYYNKNIDISGDCECLLRDACFYVDDIRLVIEVVRDAKEETVKQVALKWLQNILEQYAGTDLKIKKDKTVVTIQERDNRFLVSQSKTADKIQHEVSGVFDTLHGSELIETIEGFFHTQERYSSNNEDGSSTEDRKGLLVGISDMKDETAARFAAGRFRTTFRSLRPMLDMKTDKESDGNNDDEDEESCLPSRLVLSREQLDQRGRFFSAMLIDEWVSNPGNVRLLRIALDLYPDKSFLEHVLNLLRKCWEISDFKNQEEREVMQYCLAELFRAGATETGIVSDQDCLPLGIDDYHSRLLNEGIQIINSAIDSPSDKRRFPWYLLQQVMLYLSLNNKIPGTFLSSNFSKDDRLSRYRSLVQFLTNPSSVSTSDRARYYVIARESFNISSADLEKLVGNSIDSGMNEILWKISPFISHELSNLIEKVPSKELSKDRNKENTMVDISARELNPFVLEFNLIRLASELLTIIHNYFPAEITPQEVTCIIINSKGNIFGQLKKGSVKYVPNNQSLGRDLFVPPSWCENDDEKKRFMLGSLLRFALRGSLDFFRPIIQRKELTRHRYHAPATHWEQQRYSSFNGRSAFGPAWVPISSWAEDLLFDLLRWPGAGHNYPSKMLQEWTGEIQNRLKYLAKAKGNSTKLAFLEQSASRADNKQNIIWKRPLRIGIVQSVIPDAHNFNTNINDPKLNNHDFRIRHRRHIAALLSGVDQMLFIRETHRPREPRPSPGDDKKLLDLLIFPELAIHPDDIQQLIVPFVRSHKCIVLFGQVYHPVAPNRPGDLINSCTWVVPEWRVGAGLQVRLIEQGKAHLTTQDTSACPNVIPWRPAQWLINYQWNSRMNFRPLKLSASVCYDATDLSLASDLKSRSDLYIVCALNQDVGTFDRMSESLHYHMFQGIVVVNNGQYGGSSVYFPFSEQYYRQVLHLHGQPQASIAFAEISPLKLINRNSVANGFLPEDNNPVEPQDDPENRPEGRWKTPPANYTPVA